MTQNHRRPICKPPTIYTPAESARLTRQAEEARKEILKNGVRKNSKTNFDGK